MESGRVRGVKVWFDGGCRPNPGVITTAVLAGGHVWLRRDHGHGDNADAEWLAALDALALARDLALTDVVLLGDSAMVVAHVRAGTVPARFGGYRARFAALAAGFARVRVRHVRRGQNLAGIALDRGNA